MKTLGQAGAMPRARSGDYERALALIAAIGGDTDTKQYLHDLVAASTLHDKAHTVAKEATSQATRQSAAAREAEAAARGEREALAMETTESKTWLSSERAALTTERQQLEVLAGELDDRGADLNLREAALRRAFDAYQGEAI